MQETEKSSARTSLTVEQLLQLKRLEKPTPEFWAGFERELQQKQLQALVRPSLWARVWAAIASVPAHVAPVTAVGALCAAAGLIAFSFLAGDRHGLDYAAADHSLSASETAVLVEVADAVAEDGATTEEVVVFMPRTDFVVDAIVPEGSNGAPASFKTYYVVEAFHIGGQQPLGGGGGPFEF